MLALTGNAVDLGLNAATFVVSALFLAAVRPVRSLPHRNHEPFRSAITSGLKVHIADHRLRWATLGGTLTNLVFQPLEALLVLFVATEILGLESMEQGLTQKGILIGLFFALQAAIGSVASHLLAERRSA